MPSISKFYGITIKLYFTKNEHNPPHIHAIYGEYMSAIDIKTLDVLEGDLPKKALKMVREWIELHREEIMNIWNNQEFKKIKPLE